MKKLKDMILRFYQNDVIRYVFFGGCTTLVNLVCFFVLRKCGLELNIANLISIITTDIELLEVFYAHTISPIAIATLTSIIMVIFIRTNARHLETISDRSANLSARAL